MSAVDVEETDERVDAAWRAAAITAAVYGVLHHIGTALGPLGGVGTTRWADWIDLAIPYAVLLPAAATLVLAGAGSRCAALFLVGAIAYANGHGVHLSANSIGNVDPSPTAHLWDEVVGHYVWYAGVAIVAAAVVTALAGLRLPQTASRSSIALALLVGLTWATNALEGGTALFSAAIAGAFVVGGSLAARRGAMTTDVARLLWWAFLPALAVLLGYGAWQGGFPQPSEVGLP